jgi:hypothetical protein
MTNITKLPMIALPYLGEAARLLPGPVPTDPGCAGQRE